jgi:glutathione synthase/RimK-type ligase-like ATP-grasp enzyme
MRVLLSEGSGLTSRQVATCLGELGHDVEVLSSSALCLTRFTKHVRRVHRVPPFGDQPLAWLEQARRISRERKIDVLFPTQEQVALLSAVGHALGVATIVPPFESLRRVQDKVSAHQTLVAAKIPQPHAIIANTFDDLGAVDVFPVFVKRPISTASLGVRRADGREQLFVAARALGLGEGGAVLVQAGVAGPLAMAQFVADRGRLIACHANLRTREGASGSAATKESFVSSPITTIGEVLARALAWHGALSLDVILTDAGPLVIDVNPRLVEPRNAGFAGVDLVGAMLALARRGHPDPQPPGRAGVCTHQLLLAVLGAAQRVHARRHIVREITQAATRRGPYLRGIEELTPLTGDPLAVVPIAAVTLAVLLQPSWSRWFTGDAVGGYALTPAGWETIVRAAESNSAAPNALGGLR